ncbi:GNAT family N-acetyltransferase [Streptomyces buecherae]|uniref:GNAT family N-acetyltransferase n=1 Tax=Streptomyces buecherae TaxID=2763006 RepID=A0A7H8N551_9ACTN|nr:GNAT family N-acetyltransferase [Streptomyces buecherae]QKW49501.1 GNAT family N-acetyltransferase [Streptomyces buecherae]
MCEPAPAARPADPSVSARAEPAAPAESAAPAGAVSAEPVASAGPAPVGGVVVRPARWADGEALAAIDRRVWSPVHSPAPAPSTNPARPFFDEQGPPAQYLVVEVDGRVAGYIRLCPPTPLASNAHVRQILGLAIDDAARGRGAARALLRAACAQARAEGATRITLRVLGHNDAARKLYASEGFAVEGVLPGEFQLAGAYVDDVLMGRAL